MKLTSALAGLAMFGGVALSGAAASAMPIATHAPAAQAANVQQADYVCNPWRCWDRPFVGDGYYHPALLWRLGLAQWLASLASWLGIWRLAPLASLARLVNLKGASAPFLFCGRAGDEPECSRTSN